MRMLACIASALTAAISALPAIGETPLSTEFTYQGRLANNGIPADGSHDLRFRLFDAAIGGAPVGTFMCIDNVNVTTGFFTVPLNFGAQFSGQQRFLEIEVRPDTAQDCTNTTDFVTLSPRQALTGNPYALFALNAATAATATGATNATQLNGQLPAYYQNAANLNAGTLNAARLPSPLALIGSSATEIILGQNSSTSTSSSGLAGLSTALTGYTYGVRGQSASTDGTAVLGQATASAGSNIGVVGRSFSSNGTGVFGHAWQVGGNNTGVLGKSDSSTGIGVWGVVGAPNGTTCAVFGSNNSSEGTGVYGRVSAGSGATKAILGECFSPAGHAVYSAGNLAATGTKAFRIDHPDDPENKYLAHYCVESPEVINVYRGMVNLNETGSAKVELPSYFARINRAPSYQLTAVGTAMPNLHITNEIDDAALAVGAQAVPGKFAPMSSFRIGGGAPGARVSWEVKALRNDFWVRQHGAPVEIEKPSLERGTYQHPELYGLPAERGVNFRPKSDLASQAISNTPSEKSAIAN